MPNFKQIVVGVEKFAIGKQRALALADITAATTYSGDTADFDTKLVVLPTSGGASFTMRPNVYDVKADQVAGTIYSLTTDQEISLQVTTNIFDTALLSKITGVEYDNTNKALKLAGALPNLPTLSAVLITKTVDGVKYAIVFEKAVATVEISGNIENGAESKYTITLKPLASLDANGQPVSTVKLYELSA